MQELEASKEVELSQLEQAVCDREEAAASSHTASQVHIRQLEQQVAELRDIIDSSMHTKRSSTLKLETAMNALNLSKGDATRFIQVHALTANLVQCVVETTAVLLRCCTGQASAQAHFVFLKPQHWDVILQICPDG